MSQPIWCPKCKKAPHKAGRFCDCGTMLIVKPKDDTNKPAKR